MIIGVYYYFFILFHSSHYKTLDRELKLGKPDFTITPTTGQIILDWCNDGVNLEMIRSKINSSKTIEELTAIYHAYPEWYQQLTSEFMQKKAALQVQKESTNY